MPKEQNHPQLALLKYEIHSTLCVLQCQMLSGRHGFSY